MGMEPLADTIPLNAGWRLLLAAASDENDPSDLDWSGAIADAAVPGTVATTLSNHRAAQELETAAYDASDCWYECRFPADTSAFSAFSLNFDGLATIAEVWLNGTRILSSANMFRRYSIDVSSSIEPDNLLHIVFRSLTRNMAQKRPRPKWKTNLVNNQQLRWFRTTLLGRIPGWTPAIPPVGPWRDVTLHCAHVGLIQRCMTSPRVRANEASVDVEIIIKRASESAAISRAELALGPDRYPLAINTVGDLTTISTSVDVGSREFWNVHQAGKAVLHDYAVNVMTDHDVYNVVSGRLGFREVVAERTDGALRFVINSQPVFMRGACWTTNDIVSLSGNPRKLQSVLQAFASAGGNMIRVGGTMVYESDAFYSACDELGIAVWQDFMFANMDYPADDADFAASVQAEICDQITRLRSHPSVIVFCGNSEVEQQAAMFGMPDAVWQNPIFYELIPNALQRLQCDIPYFPSSPCEGPLPFNNRQGPAHYFGVGAYKQPVSSVRSAGVRFTSECLAFSNMPADSTLKRDFATSLPAVHTPQWKSGVPRDNTAGWDFEDIRDHYVRELYGVDPVALRYADKERYVALSQAVTGEVMTEVFGYWRSKRSDCDGGLIWQLMDIVPGAGWGIFSSDGTPKPVYYFLRRSWAAVAVIVHDLGLDGIDLEVLNETPDVLHGALEIRLLQSSSITIANVTTTVQVQPWCSTFVSVDEALGVFFDTTYRYRFGPPKHDVVSIALCDDQENLVADTRYYPAGMSLSPLNRITVTATRGTLGARQGIVLSSDAFLQTVKLTGRGIIFGENFFDLPPGVNKFVPLDGPTTDAPELRMTLAALNLANPLNIQTDAAPGQS